MSTADISLFFECKKERGREKENKTEKNTLQFACDCLFALKKKNINIKQVSKVNPISNG